ncbi:uncharacterized protein LOC119686490 isoform X2 [Teleopsis dalmanni]|nr:uncharacterized protein LOC119685607 isoform X2 [Teleopsis dalmanni]XP_037955870.1 uncharacterized protein LOC119685607 isoform X2 [Teleopsis dalmanni]XP_037957007.1 uncharacterized protein LOC119686490 isoform X2 [Teleopsis dalmanni]XP_037957008.1 uncharacterized protein LOC119686490 isoform X2 [Teleopsis dalmanni]
MESPLVASLNENILDNRSSKQDNGQNMISSVNSTLEDTTPSDSGVQMLDSESSEFMIESITSQTGFDFDDIKAQNPVKELTSYSAMASSNELNGLIQVAAIETVDTNSNVTKCTSNIEEAMTTSTCSTFDTTENIVYRRKVRKTQSGPKVPKKRVSFHEDILKNTRTDNIHIEHGFITYKNGRKLLPKTGVAGRYSWCSEGDGRSEVPTELCAQLQGEEDCDSRRRRRVVYRNACSDVLDYGNSDVYDTNESHCLQYDNSGVFEYQPQRDGSSIKGSGAETHHLYRCSCSSSNSSLDSEENDKNSNRQEYAQAKSSSCDCIGISNANNNLIGDNCYFSEPNIDNINESSKKSVWNKEKKPKSSCLKKTNTNFIYEQDINSKVKKFNVHDMNMLLDNSSKMIFGSLKSIFTMPLPERGVPEGSEDLQAVVECLPEMEQQASAELMRKELCKYPSESPPLKAKPFLSKSLDGSKQNQTTKKFVHNVDEQLRRKNMNVDLLVLKNEEETESVVRSIQRQEEFDKDDVLTTAIEAASATEVQVETKQFRNKFIINCESTVFEHTGVSYEKNSFIEDGQNKYLNFAEKNTPIAQPEHNQLRNAFISVPIAKTFSNFFRGFKESNASTPLQKSSKKSSKQQENKEIHTPDNDIAPISLSSSVKSDSINSTNSQSQPKLKNSVNTCSSTCSLVIGQDFRSTLEKQSRHLPSPLKKRTSINNLMIQPPRYGTSGVNTMSEQNSLLSPDLFNDYAGVRGGNGRDSKSTILSDEFDDILTITTDTDKNENDIVIVDYPDSNDRQNFTDCPNLLRPPQQPAKTSLINRFLRNVTQKKILETSIRKNDFFAGKLKNEQKLFANDLYVPGVRPKNYDLIDDLNAEIAMEIEMSGVNSPRRELINIESDLKGNVARFELGIGEISVDIFNGHHLHILRDKTEQLMKVFKLYTGYSREGFMTPVLVFLTDTALYVTDLVRNRLCSKFVLPYVELDVILMGPYGNTVLLSNSMRDMQQVLLAGGPYPAYGLVANLELCTRRSGSILPAVGQLTLEHLAPLRKFVRENSSVGKNDIWMYYAVVNIPVGTIGNEQEPLGPNIKGFLMHRRVKSYNAGTKQGWSPGYFLLKAGVLYMFNDSNNKLPSWAMALAECQGARRAINTGRPHCFEIMLKKELLQLAAPDEYVASEWLQALLQSASGLFEMQKKHKTLGCSLVVTENYLITLREDFTAPLQINQHNNPRDLRNEERKDMAELHYTNNDTGSLLNSALSTPVKGTQRSWSSANSTPTMLSQISKSTLGAGGSTLSSTPTSVKQTTKAANNLSNYSNMYSVYGIKSGLEILTCADIKDMTGIKIPSHNDTWWCILEFSCQEVRECTDDLVIFFSSSSEMQRFLRLLEQLWQSKNNDLFPITVLDEDDLIAEQCTMLYIDINRSWEPLLSAALGYPL